MKKRLKRSSVILLLLGVSIVILWLLFQQLNQATITLRNCQTGETVTVKASHNKNWAMAHPVTMTAEEGQKIEGKAQCDVCWQYSTFKINKSYEHLWSCDCKATATMYVYIKVSYTEKKK